MKENNIETEQKIIRHNIHFLEWFYNMHTNVLTDEGKKEAFDVMAKASIEDPACFMRIVLYFANTRKGAKQELTYRVILHFLSIMYPDWIMINIEQLIRMGAVTDVYYLIPNMSSRVMTWVKHKARTDEVFAQLMRGELTKSKIDRSVRYLPKFGKNYRWSTLLTKILDDPTFNGIQC
jgi:hypothetical protein